VLLAQGRLALARLAFDRGQTGTQLGHIGLGGNMGGNLDAAAGGIPASGSRHRDRRDLQGQPQPRP